MAKCSNFSEIEGKVSLKRRNLPKGLENMVPLSGSPTYPGSHLSEVFLMKFDKEVYGYNPNPGRSQIPKKKKKSFFFTFYLKLFNRYGN